MAAFDRFFVHHPRPASSAKFITSLQDVYRLYKTVKFSAFYSVKNCG